jgi:hypothetical protein
MAGPVTATTTYRSGSKVVVDERTPAPVVGGAMNIRTFYDFKKMEKLTWDPVHTQVRCVKDSFTGAWSDPFEGADDLSKQGAEQLGTETLHGFSTRVLQTASDANGSIKA